MYNVNMIRRLVDGLKYPPLKYNSQKIPKNLIWHSKDKYDVHYFSIFDTNNPAKYSRMACIKESTIIDEVEKTSLYILKLFANPNRQGMGTKMLNLAKKISSDIGCEGRFHLCASGCFTPENVPHIFYRKFGMNCEIAQINSKMDEFIKEGKKATTNDFKRITMFYPPVTEKQETLEQNIPLKNDKVNIFTLLKMFEI